MKTYRMATGALLIRLAFPLVLILLYAPFTPNPVSTITLLSIPFACAALFLWSANTICFENDEILNTRWLIVKKAPRKVSEIKRVRLHTESDLFSSQPWVEIKFFNDDAIALVSFNISDVREIVDRVRAIVPHTIDPGLDKYLASGKPL